MTCKLTTISYKNQCGMISNLAGKVPRKKNKKMLGKDFNLNIKS